VRAAGTKRPPISIGVGLFLVFSAILLLLPLPGKILRNSQGSFGSFSTGDSIICQGDAGPVNNRVSYKAKKGFPITYAYTATASIEMTCNGQAQTATGGQTSEFNPLGIVLDVMAAALLAWIAAMLMRRTTANR
jgi:hypothetical protein